QMALLKSGLDSLRTVVDTLVVRDSVAYAVLAETRRQLADQQMLLAGTRATTTTSSQQVFEQMGRLQIRLDEVLTRFNDVSQRASPPAASPGAPDPNQLYDNAQADLTQGRYPLALQTFREYLSRFTHT